MPGFKDLKPANVQDLSGHLIELKLDGTRMSYDGTHMTSDRGIEREDRFPHIFQELPILDAKVRGEIAVPGGHVLQVNKKENWGKARFYVFDILEHKGKDVSGNSVAENRKLLDSIFGPKKFTHLRTPLKFKSFKQGWDWVKKKNRKGYAEGLVAKNLRTRHQVKIKMLREMKAPIVSHESGSTKGAFLIMMKGGEVGKVSGTSEAFLKQYKQMIADGKKPYVEIEYQFLTDNKIPFQPRLRRMGTQDDLRTDG